MTTMLPFLNVAAIDPTKPGRLAESLGAFPDATPAQGVQAFEMLLGMFSVELPAGYSAIEVSPGEQRDMHGVNPIGLQIPAHAEFADLFGAMTKPFSFPLIQPDALSSQWSESFQSQGQGNAATEISQKYGLAQFSRAMDAHSQAAAPAVFPWTVGSLREFEVKLRPGIYQIQRHSTVDGRLNLEVNGPGQTESPVRVSIPLETLQSAPISDTPGADRSSRPTISAAKPLPVPLFESGQIGLDTLFSEVKLRELHVIPQNAKSNPVNSGLPAPVLLNFVAEQSGTRTVLTAKLQPSQFRATTNRRAGMTAAAVPDPTGNNPTPAAEFGLVFEQDAIVPRRITRPIRFANEVALPTEQTILTEAIGLDAGKASSPGTEYDASVVSRDTKPSQSGSSMRFEMPRVKISLPQDWPHTRSDGKSVILKIEPEHLGPARLHLSMRSEILTARVTVDTAQAKAAVENSLDQLTDQLNRAGVKVDLIEVSVRGGGAENQFGNRSTNWFRTQQPATGRGLGPILTEAITQVMASARPAAYISPGSVNLYA